MIERLSEGLYDLFTVKHGNRKDWYDWGKLRIFKSSGACGLSGQWHIEISPPQKQVRGWRCFLARLGLFPISFDDELESSIKQKKPMSLLFDTNAVKHGAMLSAFWACEESHLQACLSDQTLMEIQRQWETNAGTAKPNKLSPKQRAMTYLSHRALSRIYQHGFPVYSMRPSDALVRFFGAGKTTQEKEASAAPNFQRDRLILESLRALEQRLERTKITPALLTNDYNLYTQAKLEGYGAHLFWVPETRLQKPITITSPFIDFRSMKVRHVSVEEFLEELVWWTSHVKLETEGQIYNYRLSDSRLVVAQALSGVGDVSAIMKHAEIPQHVSAPKDTGPSEPPGEGEEEESNTNQRHELQEHLFSASELPSELIDVKGRAPGGATLLQTLLDIPDDPNSNAINYLEALGWWDDDSDGKLTNLGKEIARAWSEVKSVADWCDWMSMVSNYCSRLKPVARIRKEVGSGSYVGEDDLRKRLKESKTRFKFTVRFAEQFGCLLRHSELGVVVPDISTNNWEMLIINKMRELAQQSSSASVDTANLWRALLEQCPPPFFEFRRALANLVEEGKIVDAGASPSSSNSVVTILLPDSGGGVRRERLDLAKQGVLIPKRASQSFSLGINEAGE